MKINKWVYASYSYSFSHVGKCDEAVSTASFSALLTGAVAGGAAGVAGTAAGANPNLVGSILALPFRALNGPF